MPTSEDIAGTAAYVARVLAGLREIAEMRRELALLAYIISLAESEAKKKATWGE